MSKQKLVYKSEKDEWQVLKEKERKDFKLSKKMVDVFGDNLETDKEYLVEVEKSFNNKPSKITLSDSGVGIESIDDRGNFKLIKAGEIDDHIIDPPFARTPYNFIPLNDKPLFTSECVSFDKYDSDKYSGYLKVSVKNLTPLFIRQLSESADNFRYGSKYGISGSSFRGMIRTICEIISFGRFGDFDNNTLYYRQMFGNTELAKQYQKELGIKYDRNKKVSNSTSLKAGWLKKVNNKEIIFPSEPGGILNAGYERYVPTNGYKPFEFRLSNDTFYFTTGDMNRKKYGYAFNMPSDKRVPVSEKCTKSYRNDVSRSEDVNEFHKKIIKKHSNLGIPVFYKEKDGVVVHYGHTPNYRIPYKKSIKQHLPNELHKSDKPSDADLVQGLFGDAFENNDKRDQNKKGKQNMIASRISFGDLMSTDAKPYDTPQLLKILASPKPTTFQHYLNPDSNGNAQNWNKDTNIRGFKMYWHRKTNDEGSVDISWNEPNGTEKSGSHTERVKPIQPNATFSGKIWFQNLSEKELGLLCMALEPNISIDDNHKIAHKIGLAKPLGLGSIQIIIADLKILNTTRDGYFKSFGENESMYLDEDKDTLKNNFDIECAIKLGLDGGSIWDTDRLEQLKAMMTWTGKEGESEWIQKTRYMEIERDKGKNGNKKGTNEYQNRPILPKPTKVKDAQLSDFVNHKGK